MLLKKHILLSQAEIINSTLLSIGKFIEQKTNTKEHRNILFPMGDFIRVILKYKSEKFKINFNFKELYTYNDSSIVLTQYISIKHVQKRSM